MKMRRVYGACRNLTYKYNHFVSEEMDRKKSQNDSRGEIMDKNGKK